MSPGGEIVIVAPANGRGRYETGKGRVALRSKGPAFAMRYTRVPVAGKPYQGVTVEPEAAIWDAVVEAREVAIKASRGPALRFATGALDKPLAALKTCQEAQLRFWGGDPAAMAKLPPGPTLATWFGPSDYPAGAIRRGARGRSVALIKVDRAGKAVECRTVRSAGDAALDTAVCAGAKRRGRFNAAENGPEVRWATLSVRWWMP
ncbi:MAG TPA: TonB family protein [Sphingomonas sp.]|jgi:TonB family protein